MEKKLVSEIITHPYELRSLTLKAFPQTSPQSTPLPSWIRVSDAGQSSTFYVLPNLVEESGLCTYSGSFPFPE